MFVTLARARGPAVMYLYIWRETDYYGPQCNILGFLLFICLLSVPIDCVIQQIYALLAPGDNIVKYGLEPEWKATDNLTLLLLFFFFFCHSHSWALPLFAISLCLLFSLEIILFFFFFLIPASKYLFISQNQYSWPVSYYYLRLCLTP